MGYFFPPSERPAPTKPVPYLRLRGRWLRAAGFIIGEHVKIEVNERRLTIVPAT